jgi:hypothetical protein
MENSLFGWASCKMAGATQRLPIMNRGLTRPSSTFTREVGKSSVFMQTTIREMSGLRKRYKR